MIILQVHLKSSLDICQLEAVAMKRLIEYGIYGKMAILAGSYRPAGDSHFSRKVNRSAAAQTLQISHRAPRRLVEQRDRPADARSISAQTVAR